MKRLKAFSEKLKSKWANRKRLAPSVRCLLEIVAILAVYLAIALPIHYQFAVFSWHWFIFGLMALLFPCSFIYGKVYAENRQAFTKEQSQRANLLLAGRILFYWLADCAYMAIFNHWTVWICILCGITLVVVFWNLVRAFLGQAQKGGIFGLSLLLDFLVGVGLTIYLLSLITNPNLQQIITSVVAAIFGGVFTLVGVAWTIRKGDEDRKTDRLQVEADRKDEARKKLMPYLKYSERKPDECSVVKSFDWEINRERIEIDDDRVQQNTTRPCKLYGIAIDSFCVKNITENIVVFIGIRVNGEFYKLVGDLVAESKECTYFALKTSFAIDSLKPITALEIICSDILGNQYSFDCTFTIVEQQSEARTKGDLSLVFPCFLYGIKEIGLPKLEKIQETTNE